MPERIQRKRAKGWRMPPDTIIVDRSTKWGNPFRVGPGRAQAYAVKLFEHMLNGYIAVSADPTMEEQEAYRSMLIRDLAELKGKNLACWCRPDQPCHADALLKLANRT